ncbi:M61 family peptidase [Arsukibacterium sp.]|uniref:M61 family metallopeptidase n=1 Tax=Arsukibacterium sp. TaxID=1977258 RepID=UPI00299D87FE|nr:M61 family peptidase [Arsukibacterium sp.]MDX1677366.1 M61 family peptidase [Arsukibacterium sp.]
MELVSYQLKIQDIAAHHIEVTLKFTPQQPIHTLSMPAWIPGSYMIRDFAKHLLSISATDAAGPLVLQQQDKQSWQLTCRQQPVTVVYQLYAFDLSVRAAYIDDELAVLNPAALCLAVSDLENLQQQLIVPAPESAVAASWRLATALTPVGSTKALEFGTYQAADYASLIDSPLLAGVFKVEQFEVNTIPHFLVVSGNNLADLPRLAADLQQICQQQCNVFGRLPADLHQYWFLLWVTEQGYGGLEHKFSTLLLCSRYDLPGIQLQQPDDNYQQLLALCSHEYFHSWWVKRLMPAEFKPYQLAAEQYTSQLWLYEGFTSYFDDLALVRAGLIKPERYMTTLEKTISRVTRSPSDARQSLADSSFNAWTKFYKQDENAINSVVSYYGKGALVAFCLDAALREQGSSLQRLCQYMYQQYLESGTDEQSLFASLTELGYAKLADAALNWISQSKPLPLQHAAWQLGLKLSFRPAADHNDLSGPAKADSQTHFTAYLAAGLKVQNGLLTVTQVMADGAAHQAGMMVGDQLLALAGWKINEHSLPELLQRLESGSSQQLILYRKDRVLILQLPIQPAAPKIAVLQVADKDKASDWLQSDVMVQTVTIADQAAPAAS